MKIGDEVTYVNCDTIEYGVVTSMNESYVFVRYEDEKHSKATRREDLILGDFFNDYLEVYYSLQYVSGHSFNFNQIHFKDFSDFNYTPEIYKYKIGDRLNFQFKILDKVYTYRFKDGKLYYNNKQVNYDQVIRTYKIGKLKTIL